MTKPTNLERYSTHFVEHPHLTFVPSRSERFPDGDQPYATITPEQHGVPRETYTSIATYPVDGDYIIFGFRLVEHAQAFAKAVRSQIVTLDVAHARELARLVEVAYAVWYWRANHRTLSRELFLKENPRFQATLDGASERDVRIAERACRLSGSGTPMADSVMDARSHEAYEELDNS
jgi:hypothetical protein